MAFAEIRTVVKELLTMASFPLLHPTPYVP